MQGAETPVCNSKKDVPGQLHLPLKYEPDREVRNVYISGPYSADSQEKIDENVALARETMVEIVARGHNAYCPHTMTYGLEKEASVDYEDCMQMDFSYLDSWATDLVWLGASPGSDREWDRAKELNLPCYFNLDWLPDLRAADKTEST
jgi:hypothetical protein